MVGSQVRAARLAARLTQVRFAELSGLSRSRLQELEDGGNVTLGNLEKVIAHLPNLVTITLGGVEFVAVDRLRSVAGLVSRDAVGATRVQTGGDVDEATRQRLAQLDAKVDGGEIEPEREA